MAYPATPKTWVAGDVLTAAQLNAELRDALLGAFSLGPPDLAWTGYTPTLTQTGAVTKTVTYAAYSRVGRMIMANAKLTVTGTGTAGSGILIGLPVTAAQADGAIGSAYLFDTSANVVVKAVADLASTTTFALYDSNTTSPNVMGSGTSAFVAALAVGDVLSFQIVYEAAA